ncbi:MAG: hypothetical protein ABL974_22670, partial [Prosthecobacter sp.]
IIMGLWDDFTSFVGDVADAVASGAETVGDVVEGVVNAIGDAVADVVETAGNAIQDGLNAFGGLLGGIPGIGGFLSGVMAWLGGIVAGVFNFVGAIVKGVFGIIGGLIKVIGGIITLHGGLILEGLIDIGGSIAGAVISIVGTFASLIQRIIPFINADRSLTKAEMAALKSVFRNSLALYNIRIKSNNGAGGTFTLDNTIYTNIPNLAVPIHTIVHECVHVWQYQNLGSGYLAKALGAQMIFGRDPNNSCAAGNAYDWIGELNRGNMRWEKFNMEAMAQLIHEIWTDGSLNTNQVGTTVNTLETGDGAFYKKPLDPEDLHFTLTETFIASATPGSIPDPMGSTGIVLFHCARDGNDHTQLAIDSVKTMRGWWNLRLSRFLQ